MTVRPAHLSDAARIVELLKVSLGESLMPKSEDFWRWKHFDNPFGASPVLLAFEGDQLVGVRAFMRWEWKSSGKVIKAVRAVDTATHPAHQGKGIFKKLTLQLVDQCRSEGVDFIFNTPNKKSMPGYLKMGWSSLGRMELVIRPVINFRGKSSSFEESYSLGSQNLRAPAIIRPDDNTTFTTSVSREYLEWRYRNNPNVRYYAFSDDPTNPTFLTIFRLKEYGFGKEFRICDSFFCKDADKTEFARHLKEAISASGCTMVSSAIAEASSYSYSFSFKTGPVVTLLPLSSNISLTFRNWSPSMGDMEFF